jgi:hypothetical protein
MFAEEQIVRGGGALEMSDEKRAGRPLWKPQIGGRSGPAARDQKTSTFSPVT